MSEAFERKQNVEVFRSNKTGEKYDSYAAMIAAEAKYDRLESARMSEKEEGEKMEVKENLNEDKRP